MGPPSWDSQAGTCGRDHSHIGCACSSDDSGPVRLFHLVALDSDATRTSSD